MGNYIAVINGPNLNLLGKRLPDIYGTDTFEQTLADLRNEFSSIRIDYFQSNCEGELINKIQDSGFDNNCLGIVLNPGAYAHYSIAIADAIEAVSVKVVEVHISNIHAREEFRHKSVTAGACDAIISGCGRKGYSMAANWLLNEPKPQ